MRRVWRMGGCGGKWMVGDGMDVDEGADMEMGNERRWRRGVWMMGKDVKDVEGGVGAEDMDGGGWADADGGLAGGVEMADGRAD